MRRGLYGDLVLHIVTSPRFVTSGAQLKSVLVCDLVDSTRLIDRCGDILAAELLRRHDSIARGLFTEYRGNEINKSDGFLVLFDRPIDAVLFAVAYHRALEQLSHDLGFAFAARVGIHLGEIYVRESLPGGASPGSAPPQVEGLAVPVAARLMSLARPRQTLLTRAAFDIAKRGSIGVSLDTDLEWRSHTLFELKGVDDPVEVCEVGVKGSSPFIAPADTEKARRVDEDRGPRILVLPFTNLSREADTDYISDGLADEIITTLSQVEPLRVISRQSAMQLKHRKDNLRALGTQLGVHFILDGSVQKSREKLRITAQLSRAASEDILWANAWAGTMDDIFEVEETISRNVAEALRIRLNTSQLARMAERPIPNVRAYEYYLRARQDIYKFTADSLDQALQHLRKGEAIMSANPQIISAVGYVHWQMYNAGIEPDPKHLSEARQCAAKLFAFEAESPDAHRLCGLVDMHERGDIQGAVRHLRVALSANPNDTDTLLWLPLLYGFAGRSSSGYPLAERLLRVDPLTTLARIIPGFLAMLDGDFQRGRPLLLKSHELNPGNPITTLAYAQVLMMSGLGDEACEVFRSLEDIVPGSFFANLGSFYIHSIQGDRAYAREAATTGLDNAARSDLQYSWSMAQCFALVDEKDQAIQWLENAVRCGLWNYPLLADRDPLLASIRGEERFKTLMEDVRDKWINFEV